MSCRLGMFVPTYNNAYLVRDMLEKELNDIRRLGIRVYFYDSSNNSETETVVKEFRNEFDGIYYEHIPTEICSNEKIYQIFERVETEKMCDFLWLRPDNTLADPLFYRILPSILSDEYDMEIISFEQQGVRNVIHYDDIQLFLRERGWRLTKYGASILNVSRMLSDNDWRILKEKYLRPEVINFSHVSFYFDKLSRLESAKVLYLGIPWRFYKDSKLVKQRSWFKEHLNIWLKVWPSAIQNLPEYYHTKLAAIRELGRESWLFKSFALRSLYDQGVLTPDIFDEYRENWIKYSGSPLQRFYDASHGIMDTEDDERWEVQREWKETVRFCKYRHGVYIYGCGKVGKRLCVRLKDFGVNVIAFVISEKKVSDCTEWGGVPVITWAEFEEKYDGEKAILLGMNKDNCEQVLPRMLTKKYIYGTFLYPDGPSYIAAFIRSLYEMHGGDELRELMEEMENGGYERYFINV